MLVTLYKVIFKIFLGCICGIIWAPFLPTHIIWTMKATEFVLKSTYVFLDYIFEFLFKIFEFFLTLFRIF